MRRIFGLLLICVCFSPLLAQEEELDIAGEGYREKQVPGLNQAASKIFFTDRWWSIAGWGEVNFVFPTNGERDRSSGDLELYYQNLNRVAMYFSVKPAENIAFTLEPQFEFLTDGKGESHLEFIPEFYFDFLGNAHFNMRFGISPVHLGYINNNDEPILFYSVNRPETERLILPSEWVEFGLHFYGDITSDLHYAIGFLNGPKASKYTSPTWIRGGKEGRLDLHSVTINPQIEYTGIPNLTLSLSGYFGNSGQGESYLTPEGPQELKAPLAIVSGYARYDLHHLRIVAMGIWGSLGETEQIFQLSRFQNGAGEVLGNQAYGYYLEAGYDLLPLFIKNAGKEKGFFRRGEVELPVFARFERLNTHGQVKESLQDESFIQNDLTLIVLGMNFRANEHVVFKIDYMFRDNQALRSTDDADSDLIEFGLGLSF